MIKLRREDGNLLACHHTDGSTPGVMFCAGFNSDMGGVKALALEDWALSCGVQFTRFDYFGHGVSDGLLEDGSIGRWRDDALAILDEVTEGPQILVGSSMGGWIMLLTALARPERLAGLVGVAAAPDFTRRMREQRLDSGQLQRLAQTGYCEIANDYGEPYRISRTMLEEGDQHLLLASDIDLDLPVRLIHGQQDADVPWEISLAISRLLNSTDVEVQLVKNGDHRLSTDRDLQRLLLTVERLRHEVLEGKHGNSG